MNLWLKKNIIEKDFEKELHVILESQILFLICIIFHNQSETCDLFGKGWIIDSSSNCNVVLQSKCIAALHGVWIIKICYDYASPRLFGKSQWVNIFTGYFWMNGIISQDKNDKWRPGGVRVCRHEKMKKRLFSGNFGEGKTNNILEAWLSPQANPLWLHYPEGNWFTCQHSQSKVYDF